jgi:transcriptional regulator EpsA
MLWSQGDMQQLLPHDIMIAAWGDFSLGLIDFDIVSTIPGVRTEKIECANLTPLLKRLFNFWKDGSRAPFTFKMDDSLFSENKFGCNKLGSFFKTMKSALVHGIKDVRGQHDCLYVLMSPSEVSPSSSRAMFEALLPYIDNSLRQLDHLPEQSQGHASGRRALTNANESHRTLDSISIRTLDPLSADLEVDPLSSRELEIMEWVQKGKTNYEIGMILDISAFTVKNHLQRIFRKLDVMNRAQAVAKLGKFVEQNEPI